MRTSTKCPTIAAAAAISDSRGASARPTRHTFPTAFAGWFVFSAATLRHWERGNRHPTGSALVLLSVIRENPRVVIQAVRKARTLAPGSLPEIEPLESYRAPPGFGERQPPLRKRGPRRRR